MAANEHKNLTDVNRHNPKGFENALNSTVLCKTAGTGEAQQDGTLNWQSKNVMGSVDYTIIGFILNSSYSNTNYYRAVHMTDTQSPFEYGTNTSQTAVTSIIIQPANLITRSSNYVVESDSTVYKISGWLNSNADNTSTVTTLAIAKVTPTANVSDNMNPVIIKEIAVTSTGDTQKLARIEETTFSNSSLAAGDYLMAFIKDSGGGANDIYWQVKVCTTKY